jgi:phage-related protein
VLHCFTKKTNQTPKGDIEIGRKRLSDLKARLAKQKK